MRLLKTALAGLAISAVVCAPLMAAKAEVCSYPHEQTALNSRVLQTELIVAALACGDQARYNDFFKRNYGAKGQAKLDSFVTSLANQSAMQSATSGQAFCDAMSDKLWAALELPPADYGQLLASRKLAAGHGVQPCDQFAQDSATG